MRKRRPLPLHKITPHTELGYMSYGARLRFVLGREQITLRQVIDYVVEVGEYIDARKVSEALMADNSPSQWLQEQVARFLGTDVWLMYAYEHIPAMREMHDTILAIVDDDEDRFPNWLVMPFNQVFSDLGLTDEDVGLLEAGKKHPTEEQSVWIAYAYALYKWYIEMHIWRSLPQEVWYAFYDNVPEMPHPGPYPG